MNLLGKGKGETYVFPFPISIFRGEKKSITANTPFKKIKMLPVSSMGRDLWSELTL
jgi:hypothetical protein